MVVPANLARLAYCILHIDMVHAMLAQHLRDCVRLFYSFALLVHRHTHQASLQLCYS